MLLQRRTEQPEAGKSPEGHTAGLLAAKRLMAKAQERVCDIEAEIESLVLQDKICTIELVDFKSLMPSLYEDIKECRHRSTRGFTQKILHEIKMDIFETRARRYDIYRHFLVETDTSHGLNPCCDCGSYESVHHVFAQCELYSTLKSNAILEIKGIVKD